jgi:hypothetical protein
VGGGPANTVGLYTITTSTLNPGVHSITARVIDAAGFTSAVSGALPVTIDTTAPDAPSIPDLVTDTNNTTDNITSITTPTFTGTAEPNSTVAIFSGGVPVGSGPANTGGLYTITTSTLNPGAHSITARAIDAAGNFSPLSGTLIVTIDTTPPETSIVSAVDGNGRPAGNGGLTTSTSITLTLQGVDLVGIGRFECALDGFPSPCGSSASYMELLRGVHTFSVRAVDVAGNVDPTPATFSWSVEPGLVAYWPLDEGSGNQALDRSGNGYTGTLRGDDDRPTWTTGRYGAALEFDDDEDQYVSVPHAQALNGYPLTVAVWMRTTTSSGTRGLVNKNAASSGNGWNLYLVNGRLCALYFRDPSNKVFDGTACPFNVAGYDNDRWHHVAFVVDAAGGRLFVDGVQQGSVLWRGTPGAATTTQPVSLARYPGASAGHFPGLLDDVRIYNRALSGQEIQELYTGGSSVAMP